MKFKDVFIYNAAFYELFDGLDVYADIQTIQEHISDLFMHGVIGKINVSALNADVPAEYAIILDDELFDLFIESFHDYIDRLSDDQKEASEAQNRFDSVALKLGKTLIQIVSFIEWFLNGNSDICDLNEMILSSELYSAFLSLPKESVCQLHDGMINQLMGRTMKIEKKWDLKIKELYYAMSLEVFTGLYGQYAYAVEMDYYTFAGWFILFRTLTGYPELYKESLKIL